MQTPTPGKNGEKGISILLLQSQRIQGVSRHRSLLNLGADFKVPKEDWTELIRHVVARLKKDPPLPFEDLSEDFQNAVDDITQRLLDKGFDIFAKAPKESVKVFPDQIEHSDSRIVAGERLSMEAIEKLGLPEILREVGIPEPHVQLACALIVGRMLAPGSERSTAPMDDRNLVSVR